MGADQTLASFKGWISPMVAKSSRPRRQQRTLTPYQKPFHDVVAAAESGEYDDMYGPRGKPRLIDFSDHRRDPSPTEGQAPGNRRGGDGRRHGGSFAISARPGAHGKDRTAEPERCCKAALVPSNLAAAWFVTDRGSLKDVSSAGWNRLPNSSPHALAMFE